jgi:cytochrome b561
MTVKTDPEFVAATRIAAGDTGAAYGGVAKTLHWATVLLVLIQFGLSQTWKDFAPPTRRLMIAGHMSFGILLGAVVVARILWRLTPGHRVDAVVHGWTETAADAVHWLLYAMLIGEFVLGFYLRWSGGEAMSFFGLSTPPAVAEVSRATHRQIGGLHEKLGWAIVIVACGHAAAALYHHVVLKDQVLSRMLPRRRGR